MLSNAGSAQLAAGRGQPPAACVLAIRAVANVIRGSSAPAYNTLKAPCAACCRAFAVAKERTKVQNAIKVSFWFILYTIFLRSKSFLFFKQLFVFFGVNFHIFLKYFFSQVLFCKRYFIFAIIVVTFHYSYCFEYISYPSFGGRINIAF